MRKKFFHLNAKIWCRGYGGSGKKVGNYREITPQLISLLNNIIWLNADKNILNFPLHPAPVPLKNDVPLAGSEIQHGVDYFRRVERQKTGCHLPIGQKLGAVFLGFLLDE